MTSQNLIFYIVLYKIFLLKIWERQIQILVDSFSFFFVQHHVGLMSTILPFRSFLQQLLNQFNQIGVSFTCKENSNDGWWLSSDFHYSATVLVTSLPFDGFFMSFSSAGRNLCLLKRRLPYEQGEFNMTCSSRFAIIVDRFGKDSKT